MATTITSPGEKSCPPKVTGSTTVRPVRCTGGSNRNDSSTARSANAGLSTNRRHCSGRSSRASIVLPIRLTVVSKPASSSRLHIGISSSGWIVSSSAATARLIRSSPGSHRRNSKADSKMSASAARAAVSCRACDNDWTPPSALPKIEPSRANSSASASGTPSSSLITMMGIGEASRLTRSNGSSAGTASSRSSTIEVIRVSKAAI